MRLRIKILGTTVLSLLFDGSDTERCETGISGGSGHNFERSTECYIEPEEFGFR